MTKKLLVKYLSISAYTISSRNLTEANTNEIQSKFFNDDQQMCGSCIYYTYNMLTSE